MQPEKLSTSKMKNYGTLKNEIEENIRKLKDSPFLERQNEYNQNGQKYETTSIQI